MRDLIFPAILLLTFASCTLSSVSESIINTEVKIENNAIEKSQDIKGSFIITNDTDEPIGFGFSSGCQATFNIYKDGSLIFNGKRNSFCTQALTSFELEPNETKIFSLENGFDVNFTEGNYIVKSYLIGYENEVFATESFLVE